MADEIVVGTDGSIASGLVPEVIGQHIQSNDLEAGAVLRISSPENEITVTPMGRDQFMDIPASYRIEGGGFNTTIRQTGSNAQDFNLAWQNLIGFETRNNLRADPSTSTLNRKKLYPATDYWMIANIKVTGHGVMGTQPEDVITLRNLSSGKTKDIPFGELASNPRVRLIEFESSIDPYWGGRVSAASNRSSWLEIFERPAKEAAQAEHDRLVAEVELLTGNLDSYLGKFGHP